MTKKVMTLWAVIVPVMLVAWSLAQIGSQNVVAGWDGIVTIANRVHVNSAATGSGAALAGRIGAGLVATVGVSDNVATPVYLVLQDSGTVASWTARDSVAIDSVDNKVYRLHYQRTTGARKVRGLMRATALAADSIHIAVFAIRACQRIPC